MRLRDACGAAGVLGTTQPGKLPDPSDTTASLYGLCVSWLSEVPCIVLVAGITCRRRTDLDWTYMLLEWLVVNALWKGGGQRHPQSTRPEPLYPEAERLEVLRGALEAGSDVQIVYFSVSSGQETERVVTPQSLWQAQAGQWLLTAQDHLRGERRTFRVDRIRELTAAPAPPDLSMMKC